MHLGKPECDAAFPVPHLFHLFCNNDERRLTLPQISLPAFNLERLVQVRLIQVDENDLLLPVKMKFAIFPTHNRCYRIATFFIQTERIRRVALL